MEGAPGTLYEGEKFQLLFKFSSRYPFDSPQVTAAFFLSYCCLPVTALWHVLSIVSSTQPVSASLTLICIKHIVQMPFLYK